MYSSRWFQRTKNRRRRPSVSRDSTFRTFDIGILSHVNHRKPTANSLVTIENPFYYFQLIVYKHFKTGIENLGEEQEIYWEIFQCKRFRNLNWY